MQALFPSYFSVKLDGEDLSGGSRNSSLAVQTDPFLWPSIGFSEVQVFGIDLGLMNHHPGKDLSICLFKSCSHQTIPSIYHSFPFSTIRYLSCAGNSVHKLATRESLLEEDLLEYLLRVCVAQKFGSIKCSLDNFVSKAR